MEQLVTVINNIENEISIEQAEALDILQEMNKFLRYRFPRIKKLKKDPARYCETVSIKNNYLRIMAEKNEFQLYVRLGKTAVSSNKKSIVIARVEFTQTRKKHCSHLLHLLAKIAKKYNYEYISIETVNKNSRAFAERFDFIPDQQKINYTITTEKIITIINNYIELLPINKE